MRQILNVGSLNIDHVYAVEHFVRPGETLSCARYQRFPGGKGLNQSIALANAGARVFHCGKVSEEGVWLKERLARHGVDVSFVDVIGEPTGHAVIQVVPEGENSIVVFGGANRRIETADIERAAEGFGAGDFLLVQNEVSAIPDAIEAARRRAMIVVFNPAPMTPAVLEYPLDGVGLFIVNEIEARGLTGETDPAAIRAVMSRRWPKASVVVTLGAKGALYWDSTARFEQAAERVKAVDTTAAGDTFIGFFLAEWIRAGDPRRALALGCRAAALCVARPGAADSIPRGEELE